MSETTSNNISMLECVKRYFFRWGVVKRNCTAPFSFFFLYFILFFLFFLINCRQTWSVFHCCTSHMWNKMEVGEIAKVIIWVKTFFSCTLFQQLFTSVSYSIPFYSSFAKSSHYIYSLLQYKTCFIASTNRTMCDLF